MSLALILILYLPDTLTIPLGKSDRPMLLYSLSVTKLSLILSPFLSFLDTPETLRSPYRSSRPGRTGIHAPPPCSDAHYPSAGRCGRQVAYVAVRTSTTPPLE